MAELAQLTKEAWNALADRTIRVQDLYREVPGENGAPAVMRLDVEAVQGNNSQGKFFRVALEDVGGLTTALEREKENGRTLRQFETPSGDRITPAQAREALAGLQNLREENERLKARKSSGDDWSKREAELQRLHQEELDGEKARSGRYRSHLQKALLEDAAEKALREAGFTEAARALAPQLIGEMELREEGDKVFAVVRSQEGGARLVSDGSGGTRNMTAVDRAKEFQKDPYWSKFLDAEDSSGGGDVEEADVPTPRRRPAQTATSPGSDTETDTVRPMERLRQARRAASEQQA